MKKVKTIVYKNISFNIVVSLFSAERHPGGKRTYQIVVHKNGAEPRTLETIRFSNILGEYHEVYTNVAEAELFTKIETLTKEMEKWIDREVVHSEIEVELEKLGFTNVQI